MQPRLQLGTSKPIFRHVASHIFVRPILGDFWKVAKVKDKLGQLLTLLRIVK